MSAPPCAEDPLRLARAIERATLAYARAMGASRAAALLAALARAQHLASAPPPYRRPRPRGAR